MQLKLSPNFLKLGCVLAAMTFAHSLAAQTVVRVQSNVGIFDLELFDSVAPGTVTNFLNYIQSGRFNDSVVHRAEPGFVIQGGRYIIPEGTTTLTLLERDPPIVNEFKLQNFRGTIAMAKAPGDPDSASSEWFINLADNSSLDLSNGGFTVFGRVLGSGMRIVDNIARGTPYANIEGIPFNIPTTDFDGQNLLRENLILLDMSVLAPANTPNFFDPSTGILRFRISQGSLGVMSLAFGLVTESPEVIIRALPESLSWLPATEGQLSTFDDTTDELVIPELGINGEVAFRNLRLQLTDPERLLFTLTSFEQ